MYSCVLYNCTCTLACSKGLEFSFPKKRKEGEKDGWYFDRLFLKMVTNSNALIIINDIMYFIMFTKMYTCALQPHSRHTHYLLSLFYFYFFSVVMVFYFLRSVSIFRFVHVNRGIKITKLRRGGGADGDGGLKSFEEFILISPNYCNCMH